MLGTLGIQRTGDDEHYAEWDDFSLAEASDEKPVTRGLHVAFVAPSHARVDKFWRVGTEAGHRDDGAPGPRPQYSDDYYGAFLLDPDGNSAEAVHHDSLRRGGGIDHLWIRVADVAAARRFHMAFPVADNATVDAFHRAATEAGYRDNGAAGERPVYHRGYYGAFVLDPDGNNVELVNHNRG